MKEAGIIKLGPKDGKHNVVNWVQSVYDGVTKWERQQLGFPHVSHSELSRRMERGCVVVISESNEPVSIAVGFPDEYSGECGLTVATVCDKRNSGHFKNSFEGILGLCKIAECPMKRLVVTTNNSAVTGQCVKNRLAGGYSREAGANVYSLTRMG